MASGATSNAETRRVIALLTLFFLALVGCIPSGEEDVLAVRAGIPPSWLEIEGPVESSLDPYGFVYRQYAGTEMIFQGIRARAVLHGFEHGVPKVVLAYWDIQYAKELTDACLHTFGENPDYLLETVDSSGVRTQELKWIRPLPRVAEVRTQRCPCGAPDPSPRDLGLGEPDGFVSLRIALE